MTKKLIVTITLTAISMNHSFDSDFGRATLAKTVARHDPVIKAITELKFSERRAAAIVPPIKRNEYTIVSNDALYQVISTSGIRLLKSDSRPV